MFHAHFKRIFVSQFLQRCVFPVVHYRVFSLSPGMTKPFQSGVRVEILVSCVILLVLSALQSNVIESLIFNVDRLLTASVLRVNLCFLMEELCQERSASLIRPGQEFNTSNQN